MILNNFGNILKARKMHTNIPSTMHSNDLSADDGHSITEVFPGYFKSVFEPTTFTSMSTDYQNQFNFLCDVSQYVVNLINNFNLNTSLQGLDCDKDVGFDGIPAYLLKNCSFSFTVSLEILLKTYLGSQLFPAVWKKALNPQIQGLELIIIEPY